MPSYEVHHSYPLTPSQRQFLATDITNLHCSTFATPSFFVHVSFVAHDAGDGTYFMAGKPRTTCANRIAGHVRTSPSRSRADFDALAALIEQAWYEVLEGPAARQDGAEGSQPAAEEEAKRLLKISFHPMLAVREGGMAIPEAGREGKWFKEQLPYMKDMSERKGLEDFTDLLKELEEREDLKKLLK